MLVEAMPLFHPVQLARPLARLFACGSLLLFLACCAVAAAQPSATATLRPAFEASLDAVPDAPLPQSSIPQSPISQSQDPAAPGTGKAVTLRDTPLNIVKDQGAIWTSPVRLREGDLKWLVPLGLATAVAITTDHQAMSSEVSHDPKFNHDNVVASDVFTGALVAVPVLLIGKGQWRNDNQDKEAGILSGEALVDGVVVEQGMKLIFWRERPSADNAKGKFFQAGVGVDSSFPSSHSVLAWSSAAVLAEEYPSWWQQLGIYSMAAGVSVTRVLGQEHFPSDVLVGSAVGWIKYVVETKLNRDELFRCLLLGSGG